MQIIPFDLCPLLVTHSKCAELRNYGKLATGDEWTSFVIVWWMLLTRRLLMKTCVGNKMITMIYIRTSSPIWFQHRTWSICMPKSNL